jgi:Carboxypeptidase regulatory-like domain/TonB dependent receptor
MTRFKTTHLTAVSLLAILATTPSIHAQETTSAIDGSITTEDGSPVSGATITITHVPSGTRATSVTNADGSFSANGLRIGGPFSVEISKTGYQNQTVQDIFIQVASTFKLATQLSPEGTDAGSIIITASKLKRSGQLQTGSASDFSAEQIAGVASISKDIRDVLRRDPLANFDPSNRSLSIGGSQARSNRFSVDGVAVQDDFGLNQGGLPSLRGIVSIDAIDQVTLSAAPFDVSEGDFQGGSVNAILKSGTNEYNLAAYYTYGSDKLTGDKLRGVATPQDFSFKNWGVFASGPIIKDKLFVALNYEKLSESSIFDTGIAGEGFANVVPRLSRATVDQVRSIVQSVYNYDAKNAVNSLPENDRKISGKLDWNITDGQRASFTYIDHRNAVPLVGTGSSISNNAPRLNLQSNFYETTENSKIYTGQINSSWTDNFSTELRVSYRDYKRGQESFGGNDFAEFIVCTDQTSITNSPVAGVTNNNISCGNTPTINLGPDQFRQANSLATTNLNGQFNAQLRLNDHKLKLQIEAQRVSIDNVFVPSSDGRIYFDSLADLQNRRASRLQYTNALTANPQDAAAQFSYRTFSFGLQDNWKALDNLDVLIGVRFDMFDQDQNVARNPNFTTRYPGQTNTKTLNGLSLIQPRIGFSWTATDEIKLSGGVGLFGGGTPDVFISNSYSVDGIRTNSLDIQRSATGVFRDFASTVITPPLVGLAPVGPAALDSVNGLTFPSLVDQYLGAGNILALPISSSTTNSIAPDFSIPSSWRSNLSLTYKPAWELLGGGWEFRADALFGSVKNGLVYTDLRARPLITTIAGAQRVEVLPDGRPRYDASVGANSDLQLRNTKDGWNYALSVGVSKDFDFGLSLGLSYTRTRANDLLSNPNGSTSNGGYGSATNDPNNAGSGRSTLEVKDNYKLRVGYSKAFFGDFKTRIDLFGERRSGRPFTYTFRDASTQARSPVFGTILNGRYQIFVPDFKGDTNTADLQVGNVTFNSAASLAALKAIVETSGLNNFQGQIAPRGTDRNPTFNKLDLKISQEIPAFFRDSRFTVFGEMENFLNLIDSDWNSFRQFGDQVTLVDVACTAANATSACPGYVYSNVASPTLVSNVKASLWRVNLGIRYDF